MSAKLPQAASKEIKLPCFSNTNPELWLETVDALLSLEENDDPKYELVKRHLRGGKDEYLIANFHDEIRNHVGDPYAGFRAFIVQQNKECQDHNLASVESFTCRELKPSAFLRHVESVLYAIPKSMKRLFWLCRLPRSIQKILMAAILRDAAPMEDKSLEGLAAVADGVAAYEKYHSWSTLPNGKTVVVKLPTYDENDPELWFYSLDEAFSSAKVTDDDVKFEATSKALRSNHILTASLFLTGLPNRTNCNRYGNLRERIIETFAVIKGDAIYRLVFRNREELKPSKFYKLLNDLAAKSGKAVSQLIIRTLWIMQLPIRTQAILFKVINASREPLQDLDMATLCLLADSALNSDKNLNRLIGHLSAPEISRNEVDTNMLNMELQMAKTLEAKVALGMHYCDFMYRVYYDHSPGESITDCTVFKTFREERLGPRDYFARGCECWYHRTYGEDAVNCAQVQGSDDEDSAVPKLKTDFYTYGE